MKIAYGILLAILTFLAVASGMTKVLLMQQDVEFFGRYGFNSLGLIAFGAVQLLGGVLLPFKKTRFAGAAIVATTFVVSLVILLMDGSIPVSAITLIATLLLGLVMKLSWRSES